MEKIKQRPDGHYIQMVSLGKDTSGKPRRMAVYGATPEELRDKVQALRREASVDADLRDGRTAFADVAQDWLNGKRELLSRSTADGYTSALSKHIAPDFGGLALNKLTASRLKKLFARMKKEGYSESVMKTVKLCAVQTLDYARERGWKGDNVFRSVETPEAPALPIRTLTEDELRMILDKPTGHPMCAAALMMLLCGIRRGEMLALRWENVSRAGIVIQSIVVFKDGKPCLQDAGSAKRRIPVPNLLYQLLRDEWRDEGLVCPGKDGGLIGEGAYAALWESYERFLFSGPQKRLRSKQASNGKIRCIAPSMLRQTYAQMLFRSGADLLAAQSFLGHTTLEMTAKLYSQLIKPDVADAIAKYDDWLAGAWK